MGSLVVCLPHPHTGNYATISWSPRVEFVLTRDLSPVAGGQLAVRHQGRGLVYDWAAESTKDQIQWAAFFSDCEHEVLEVTEGHRITLTYNLHWAAAPAASQVRAETSQSLAVVQALRGLLDCPDFFPSGASC